MNKFLVAATFVLLAGASALPAVARDSSGQGDRATTQHWDRGHDRDHDRDWGDRHGRDGWRRDGRHDGWQGRDWRDRDHHDRWRRGHDRDDGYRRHDRDGRYWAVHRYRAPWRYAYPSGYRPYAWRVGHRLPPSYYARPYYIDYRYYRLPPPPYGYQWVRVDNDVILVAIGSGLIREVLHGLFH